MGITEMTVSSFTRVSQSEAEYVQLFMFNTLNLVLLQIIGLPTMPPYWSLGFHLCRYGYNSIENMKMVRSRMQANNIPQDVQWNDIDYMNAYRDFTIDNDKFAGLSEFVDDLHEKGMHYVIITVSQY